MQFALAIDGVVRDLWTAKPVLHDDLMSQVVEVGDDVQPGWVSDGQGGFTAPAEPNALEVRVAAIDVALAALDAAAIRSLRAVLAARQAEVTPAPEDVAMLASLESQAVALRVERAGLIE